MSGFLLHVGATALCPHAGQVSIQASGTQVKVNGQAVVTLNDTFTISGCPFQVPATPTKPQPCVSIRWIVPASRVRINGQAVLLSNSSGICQSAEQIPQGPPNIIVTQTRVSGI